MDTASRRVPKRCRSPLTMERACKTGAAGISVCTEEHVAVARVLACEKCAWGSEDAMSVATENEQMALQHCSPEGYLEWPRDRRHWRPRKED